MNALDTGIFICEANVADAGEISNTINDAFCKAEPFRKEGCSRITPAEVEEEILNPARGKWYVLKEPPGAETRRAGRVASTILYRSESLECGSIHLFTTRVDAQGKGYGTRLLQAVAFLAAEVGRSHLFLWTVSTGKLISFYRKMGFEATGRRGRYDAAFLQEEYIGKIAIVEMVKNLVPENKS